MAPSTEGGGIQGGFVWETSAPGPDPQGQIERPLVYYIVSLHAGTGRQNVCKDWLLEWKV